MTTAGGLWENRRAVWLWRQVKDAASWFNARSPVFHALLLGLITAQIYGGAVDGWWTNDDPLILKQAILHTPFEYFFVPHAWQELTAASFTPLLTLSYQLDHVLFGLNPAPYYVHQLISVASVGVAFYLLLSLWVPRAFAFLGALLLLASAPIALASAWLGIRQYLEGMIAALLACHAWIRFLREGSPIHRWLGVGLYLFAMLAKEVYVPLIGLLLLFPEQSWRDRLRLSWPLWAVLALYLIWRFLMLSGHAGGYGVFAATSWVELPYLAVLSMLLPFGILFTLFGLNWATSVWIGIFGAACVTWLRRHPIRNFGVSVVLWLLVAIPLVPIIPLVFRMHDLVEVGRFALVPGAIMIAGLIVVLDRVAITGQRKAAGVMVVVLIGLGLGWQARDVYGRWGSYASVLKSEGGFLQQGAPEPRMLSVSFHEVVFYRGLHWLNQHAGMADMPITVHGGYFALELMEKIVPWQRGSSGTTRAANALGRQRRA